VKELKLDGIATAAAANPFIREVYLPAHNARFAVAPLVGHDNCVSYRTLKLQILESPMRPISVTQRFDSPGVEFAKKVANRCACRWPAGKRKRAWFGHWKRTRGDVHRIAFRRSCFATNPAQA
jgi:hypothetical protein